MKKKKTILDFAKEKLKNEYILLTVIFLIITPIFLTPWIHSNDGVGYYSYVRSAIIDGDIDLKNELDHYSNQYHIASIRQDPNTGNYFSQYPFGVPLLWSPYFLIGHGITSVTDYPADGYSMPYVYMICLGSAINAFIGLLLVYSMLKKYFKKGIAMLSLITIWLASPLFYYMYFESSVSHANSFFIFTLFVWFWHRTFKKRNTWQWMVLGLLAGIAMLVRYQNVMLLALPLCEVVPAYWKNITKKKWKPVLAEFQKHILSALIFLVVMLPQLIMLQINHGAIRNINYDGEFSFISVFVNALKVLFSDHHGLFNWTPILLFAFIGLFLFFKKQKFLTKMFFTLFVVNLTFISGWSLWYGSQSFGHRMFVGMSIVFMFGLAALLERLSKKISIKWLIFICALFVAWNFGLMVQYGSRMIDSEKAVPLLERAKNNIIEVPRKLFILIKKFLFSRGEFL